MMRLIVAVWMTEPPVAVTFTAKEPVERLLGLTTVGVDSAAAAATEHTEGGERAEQGEDAPAAGAARKEDEEQAGEGYTQARGGSGARRRDCGLHGMPGRRRTGLRPLPERW